MNYQNFKNKNQTFLLTCISEFFPLTESHLYSFRKILNWQLVSVNKNIDWTGIDISHYFDEVSQSIKGANDLEEPCLETSLNPTFKWDEILSKHNDKNFDWDLLVQNKVFMSNQSLVDKYASDIPPYSNLFDDSGIDEKYEGDENFNFFDTTSPSWNFKQEYINEYPENIDWTIKTITKNQEKINWYWLSRFKKLRWNNELISVFKEYWDIEGLLLNPSVRIDIDTLLALDPNEKILLMPAIRKRLWEEVFSAVLSSYDILNILSCQDQTI